MDGLSIHVDDLLGSVTRSLVLDVQVRAARVDGLKSRLESVSPANTLRRGYAVVQTEVVVTDATQVKVGDSVQVTLARGEFDAEVISVCARGEVDKLDGLILDSDGS